MKKLIMLVALVAMGLSASAATVDWKMTVASDAKGYQTMFFAFSDLANVTTALSEGGKDVFTTLQGYAVQDNKGAKTFATGSKSQNLTGKYFVGMDSSSELFAVVFDTKETASIVDGMTYGMSGKYSVGEYAYDPDADPPESSPGTFAFDLSSGLTKGSIGVPEPTSGLLLVLGGAMLALRRRRA